MNDLGSLVAHRLALLGMKDFELAHALGKKPSFVSRLRHGEVKTLPPPEELQIMAETLRVPMVELVVAAGYPVAEVETGTSEVDELTEHARLVDWERDPARLPVMHAIMETWSRFDAMLSHV